MDRIVLIVEFEKSDARCFLLQKQFLLSNHQLRGVKGIATVFEHLRSIQYDPQNPCGRNVDLVLQARVKGTHPNDYYSWIYEERKGVEAFDKELCVIPVNDVSFCRKCYSPSREKKLALFLQKNKKKLDTIIKDIDANGPISANHIDDERKVDIFWSEARWGKAALDSLWKAGKLVITNRKNGRKYFDLPQRVYGNQFEWNPTRTSPVTKEHVLRRLKSVGLLPITGTGQGWLGIGNGKEIVPKITESIKTGEIEEVAIKGVKSKYAVLAKELEEFDKQEKTIIDKRTVFLAPLDNLSWDRKMIKELFDFDYKWEVYTPKKIRKFGHYALPILYGTDFIGRIEPIKTKKGELEIRGLWMETEWKNDVRTAFEQCLIDFKKYLGAEKIRWTCKPPKGIQTR